TLDPTGEGQVDTDQLETAPGTSEAMTVDLRADRVPASLLESTTRAMAPLRVSLTQARAEDGEQTLEIAELLGVSDPRQLDPEQLWRQRAPEDFLRVPFGVNDQGAPVHLDLKESAQLGMGPHGICVGATGSGKSEML